MNSEPFTFAARVRPTSWGDFRGIATTTDELGAGGEAFPNWIIYLNSSGNIGSYLGSHRVGSTVLAVDEWAHVAVTFDGDTLKHYINGVEDLTASAVGYTADAGEFLSLFAFENDARATGTNDHFRGYVDDFHIYNGALSADKIQQLADEAYKFPSLHYTGRDRFGPNDGILIDQAGNGNNGTIVNSVPIVADNDAGGGLCLDFDSASDHYITTELTPTAGVPWTIFCHFKAEGSDAENELIVSDNGPTGTRDFCNLQLSNGVLRCIMPGVTITSSSGDLRGDGLWHTAALVHDGALGVELFFDGVSAGTGTMSSFSVFLGPWYVGSSHRNPTLNTMNGKMDDIRIYPNALSVNELSFMSGARNMEFPEIDDGLVLRVSPTNDPDGVSNTTAKNLVDLSVMTLNGGLGYETTNTERGGEAALDFDGVDDTLDLPAPQTFTGDFGVSFWKAANTSEKIIGSGSSAHSIEQIDSTTIRVGFGTNADFTVPANDAEMHHIVVTRSGGNLRLYYDGTESSTGAISNSDSVTIGRFGGDSAGADFSGLLDEVRVYDRAVQSHEVTDLFAMQRPGKPVSFNETFSQGTHGQNPRLIFYWPAQDDAASTDVLDSSGYGNDGTLSGGSNTSTITDTGPESWLTKGLHFNGSTDYITIPSLLSLISNEATLLLKTKLDADPPGASAQSGFAVLDSDSGNTSHFPFTDGNIYCGIWRAATGRVTVGNPAESLTAWRDITVRAKPGAGNWEFLIDGASKATATGASTLTSIANWRIGANTSGSVFMDGTVAAIAVFCCYVNDLILDEYGTGPEAVVTAAATLGTPTVGAEITPSGMTAEIDPAFSGNNGTVSFEFWWYLADDTLGTNETLVEVTDSPAGYTPVVADETKQLRALVKPKNLGGKDSAEAWYTNYSQVQAASASFSATAALTLPAVTFSASATFTAPPTYTATAALALPAIQFAATATHTEPTFAASAALALAPIAFTASGTVVNPTYDASASLTLAGITFSGNATFGVDMFTATASLDLAPIEVTASGSTSVPTYTATAALTLPAIEFTSTGETFPPVVTASAAVTLPAIEFAGSASTAEDLFVASAALVLPAISVSGSASFIADTVFDGSASLALAPIDIAATGSTVTPGVSGSASMSIPAIAISAFANFGPPSYNATVGVTLSPILFQATNSDTGMIVLYYFYAGSD